MSTTASPNGPSPNLSASPYDLTNTPSSDDDSWRYLDYSSSGSVGFLPSPASGSLNGYAVVGHLPLPAVESPQFLDLDEPQFPAQGSMSGGSGGNASDGLGRNMSEGDGFAGVGADMGEASFRTGGEAFLTPQDLLLTDAQMDEIGLFEDFTSDMPLQHLNVLPPQTDFNVLDFRPDGDMTGWDLGPINPDPTVSPVLDDLSSQTSHSPQPGPSNKSTHPGRKVRTGKVEKKKTRRKDRPAFTPADETGKFVIMTPTSITAQAGRPNPFECFEEALRPSHKGRKGPLANGTKESALQVRRLGACFCCHSRKVRCDKERPCRNCVKLAAGVPQVVCWQFQDFIPVLFPGFVRRHLRKDEMARFLDENIEEFGGPEGGEGFDVGLFSGPRFRSVLVIPRARFFTARTKEVLTHWHLQAERGGVNLLARGAVPIGLDPGGGAQRDEVRKRAKEYVRSLLGEPLFAEQLTETFEHTKLPRRVLEIVQRYWMQSEATVVRRALSVYTLHYILTRHLCMTRPTILSLAASPLVPQDVPWVTPRVLNRQVKAVLDEQMQREAQAVFDLFSRSLKPKARREWAPCLAAFLVLCLFMESVEAAADNFVAAQEEIRLRGGEAEGEQLARKVALGVNEEIEKLPFRQFAFQFHQVFQTHSKDASAKAFNPLVDDEFAEKGELDAAGGELVCGLRELLQGDGRSELDFLATDPLSPNENHPYPRDVAFDYTGRLVSKFLLSFTDDRYIFDA